MKTITLLILCIVNSVLAFPQPYLKFTGTNRGLEISLGAMSKDGGLDFNVAYRSSLSRNDKPKIISAAFGKQMLLTFNEEDNYSFTPSVGYGYLAWKEYQDVSPSENPQLIYDKVVSMQEFKPLIGLELAKDSYMGRYGLTVAWCGLFYFGITLRMFPFRNRRA